MSHSVIIFLFSSVDETLPLALPSCTKSCFSVFSLSGSTAKCHSGLSDDVPSELPWSPLSLQAFPAHHLSVPVVAVISFALPLLFLDLCGVVCWLFLCPHSPSVMIALRSFAVILGSCYAVFLWPFLRMLDMLPQCY